MSIKALSDYTFYSRYARYNKDKKRRETWDEAVSRVFDMHRQKYATQIQENPELEELISFAEGMQKKKRVLAAQRSLQFAGDPIFKHELKVFNCLFTHIDRPRVFQEIIYSLLCGCGVGFSVQKHHVKNLPSIKRFISRPKKTYIIQDSIEGWSDAVGVLMDSYFQTSEEFEDYHGCEIEFDFSLIRPEGTLIAGQFKAPGPNGLMSSLKKINKVIFSRINEDNPSEIELRPIDCYDIIMHISDAVLSGGVRRSATLCMFSHDDDEMLNAKIGDWFITNPQRARSNNSATLLKGHVTREEFHKLMESTKQFGEPGFIWVDDLDIGYNPCITGDAILKVKDHDIIENGNIIARGVEYTMPLSVYVANYIGHEESPLVLSHNVSTGVDEYRHVSAAQLTRKNAEILKIELSDGKTLRCTPDHKIFTTNRGYVQAKDLVAVDCIKTTDGDFILAAYTQASHEDVYDLSVPGNVNFYANDILVHNCVEIGLYPKTRDGKSGFQGCVRSKTKLITKQGIVEIGDVIGSEIDIWNGEKWSTVTPIETGKNREFYRVTFGDGSYLDATENHKFLAKNRFDKNYKEYSTLELIDQLQNSKYTLSVPRANIIRDEENKINEENAYDYGFILGDGSTWSDKQAATAIVYECNYKHNFPLGGILQSERVCPKGGNKFKTYYWGAGSMDFDFIRNLKGDVNLPLDVISNWNRQSIIQFFAGWIDTNGTIMENGSCRIYGKEHQLRDAQILLTSLGIDSSLNLASKKGSKTNFGIRNRDLYYLQITDTKDLVAYKGILQSKSVKFKSKNQTIKSIVKLEGVIEDSFCFEEPELHQGVFNNVLTKQCNLTEINGKWCDTEDNFYKACKASAIIGTLQAGYTNFKYLTPESKEIFDEEALLGCSITGMMDNPDLLFNEKVQKNAAQVILDTNKTVATLIGIKPCARATCVKPAGSTSSVLGTASGIHPHHAKRYIRRVQANKSEFCLQETMNKNPLAVEESVWSANKTDMVISFLCEVPSGAIVKNQLKAVDLLEKVKLTQQNWVANGTVIERCVNPKTRHNVSNTITVKPDEWDEVENFIFDNQQWFAGISLLSASGDLDYAQAPFSTVLTPTELVKEYGDASVFASGLIVDGLVAFDNNLWRACDTVLGYGEDLTNGPEPAVYPSTRNYSDLASYFIKKEASEKHYNKLDWVRRVKQFADRYFDGDVRRSTYCLKHVSLWKTWCDLKREYVEIDWTQVIEEHETHVNADTLGSQACSNGSCDILL